MKYNLVFIEGWPASGKTALWACLDCIGEVFVEPLHVYALNSMFGLKFSGQEKRKLTVREVRKALLHTEYYKTEQYSLDGHFPISFGANMSERAKFEFDWNRFDTEFINRITSKAISADEYIEAYIDCYLDSYQYGRFKEKVKTFVTMTNYFEYRRLYELRNVIDFKLVQVQRSYRDIIWSRIARKPRLQDGKESHHFAPSFNFLMSSSEVQSIITFDNFYKNKSDVFLVITLKDLIDKTEITMRKVVSYLEIDWRDEFLLETRDGIPISSRFKLTSHSNDIPDFGFWQRISLMVHYSLVKCFKLKFNLFSLRAILIHFGIKLKKFLI